MEVLSRTISYNRGGWDLQISRPGVDVDTQRLRRRAELDGRDVLVVAWCWIVGHDARLVLSCFPVSEFQLMLRGKPLAQKNVLLTKPAS